MSGTTEPVLVDGLDQVLLIRLYPEAEGLSDAGAKAVAQGTQTAADGAALEASQYEPVLGLEAPDAPAAPTAPPVNVDVPYVTQTGDMLSCTMGIWDGEPTGYAYQWTIDGVAVGTDASTHTVVAGDAGKTAACVVSATNALGTTAAPPSNGVVVTAPAR
jgi:hypothetical protein